MIETTNEKIIKSGPWGSEFGEWERVTNGELTNEECQTLDSSSPQIEVLHCNFKNIDDNKLHKNTYYLIKREDGNTETWLYCGRGRIDSSYCVLTRPMIQPDWKNKIHGKYEKKNYKFLQEEKIYNHNFNKIEEHFKNHKPSFRQNSEERDSYPPFIFSYKEPLESGYYEFKLQNVVFGHCWVEMFEKFRCGNKTEVTYKTGSYTIIIDPLPMSKVLKL